MRLREWTCSRGRVAKIMAIIKREHTQAFWMRINYIFGKTIGGSPMSVQVPREGHGDMVDEYTTQATMQEAIWSNIHYKRFYMAEEAPICRGYD